MEPQPDNIFLIIDSLPTMGIEPPRKSTIDNRGRVELFTSALNLLPNDSPVNVILFPMEGDPMAAPSYWRLARLPGAHFWHHQRIGLNRDQEDWDERVWIEMTWTI